ncbi:MAG: T9SS type A sorting domain-containing protein, partial [Bacteroidales bacterium]
LDTNFPDFDIEGGERTDYFEITNLSTSNKEVRVYIEKLSMATDSELLMCVPPNCTTDTISEASITLLPNVPFTEFDFLYFYQNDMPSIIKVNLINPVIDPIEIIQSFVVVYKNLNASIAKPTKPINKITSLEVYPNPANYNTTINYSLAANYNSGKIIIRNMIGQELKSISINAGTSAKQVVSTSDLPNGIYFYSIVGDGQTISTKKLIVKH